jgi:hypothetical protein
MCTQKLNGYIPYLKYVSLQYITKNRRQNINKMHQRTAILNPFPVFLASLFLCRVGEPGLTMEQELQAIVKEQHAINAEVSAMFSLHSPIMQPQIVESSCIFVSRRTRPPILRSVSHIRCTICYALTICCIAFRLVHIEENHAI